MSILKQGLTPAIDDITLRSAHIDPCIEFVKPAEGLEIWRGQCQPVSLF